jgi:mono/diheme cytochrome c family protein
MHHSFVRLVPVLRGALLTAVLTGVLAGCGTGGNGEPPATAATPPSPGARLYLQNCIACHQRSGQGVPGVQPSLAGTTVTVGDPEALLAWVMYGVRPETLPKGQYRGVMPQYAYLQDDGLADLLTYVRTSFGNSASAITPEMVAKVRVAHAK